MCVVHYVQKTIVICALFYALSYLVYVRYICYTITKLRNQAQNERKKSEIQNAIECLKCPDEMLDKYLMLVSLKYPNSGRIIAENGDFKRHSFNRLYVYNTAKMILAN